MAAPRAAAFLLAVASAALLLSAGACKPGQQRPRGSYRAASDSFTYLITPAPSPPRAREQTAYTVYVRDAKTGQPVEGGEGRIFASNKDQANIWDGFTYGPEVGTYRANLRFITAGLWAVAIQFRRDSTRPLDRVDWNQEVRAERAGAP